MGSASSSLARASRRPRGPAAPILLGLALGLLSPASRAEPPPPDLPDGWIVQKLDGTDGEILRPTSWSFRERPTPSGFEWTLADEFRADGSYLTGMKILFSHFSSEAEERPERAAQEIIASIERSVPTIVSTCGPVSHGRFTNQCIEVVQPIASLLPNEPFHVVYGVWWSEEILVVSIFGAPEGRWGAVEPIYAAMANFVLIGPRFGARGSAQETSPSPESPSPTRATDEAAP